ncbi:hypothetical protein ACFZDI_30655 [Streptomyces sp. NPDC007907]|uniref:hypothetical protein n=1 Tax=Streptomyces sp. NPDC007907 TaxID=3364789 RepID=UPI0036F0E9EC
MRLQRPGLPALLAFRHPPVAPHRPLPDSYALRDPGRRAGLPAPAGPRSRGWSPAIPHPRAFAGRPLVVGPGVTWTLWLPWEGEQSAVQRAVTASCAGRGAPWP